MGCLFEFFFELFFEFFFELFFYVYMKLMTLFVPKETITTTTLKKIKTVVKVFSVLLLVMLIISFVMSISGDPAVEKIGKYILYITLSIVVIQIILGIIIKIFSKVKK